jgi:CRISPR-associated protein (TIGR03984 family)
VNRIAGCTISGLDDKACRTWLGRVLGETESPMGGGNWLLAHCDDGVTWGRFDEGKWRLGSDVYPDLCPRPTELNLQELRVFSHGEEVLLWRVAGGFRGRVVRDGPALDRDDPLRHHEVGQVLLGDRVLDRADGFTRVGDGSGAEQALPLVLEREPAAHRPRLLLRHFFARDESTGAVRVAVTRLLDLEWESN